MKSTQENDSRTYCNAHHYGNDGKPWHFHIYHAKINLLWYLQDTLILGSLQYHHIPKYHRSDSIIVQC